MRILIAEDNEDNLLLFKAYLKNSQDEIDYAVNGKEAVEYFEKSPHDLILMDIEMPVLDGFGAVTAIRKLEAEKGTPRTTIYALTSVEDPEEVQKMFTVGCDAHVLKPIKKEAFLDLIARFRLKAS